MLLGLEQFHFRPLLPVPWLTRAFPHCAAGWLNAPGERACCWMQEGAGATSFPSLTHPGLLGGAAGGGVCWAVVVGWLLQPAHGWFSSRRTPPSSRRGLLGPRATLGHATTTWRTIFKSSARASYMCHFLGPCRAPSPLHWVGRQVPAGCRPWEGVGEVKTY